MRASLFIYVTCFLSKVAVAGIPPLATEQTPKSVFIQPAALIDIGIPGLGEEVASWIAQELSSHQKAFSRVVTQAELEQQLKAENMRRILDCDDPNECLARIQSQTNADLLVSGSIGRVGRDFLFTVSVLDPRTATALNRVGETAHTPQELKAKMGPIVEQLFHLSPKPPLRFSLPYRESLRIGIFSIDATGVDKKTVRNLSQLLAVELAKIRGAEIISPADIEAILGAAKYRAILSGDCEEDCLTRISGSLNVEYIVVGSVGRLDSAYFISLRLIDQRAVRVVHRVTETFRGPEEELRRAIRTVGRRLLGIETRGEGTLAVSGPISGAEVSVGDQVLGSIPFKSDILYPAGRLGVRITKPGYLDWRSDVFIQPGETNLIWADLKTEGKTKLLDRWWFWTIIGTAIIGGTTAGVLMSRRNDESGPIDIIVGEPR